MITPLYFDTSAAAKLFFRSEKGARELGTFLGRLDSYSLRSSSLMRLEMYSVVRQKLILSRRSPESFYEEIQTWREYEARRFFFVPMDDAFLQRVRELMVRAPAEISLGTLDFIHLGACMQTNEKYPHTVMVTSDRALASGARTLGILVFDPENPNVIPL